VYVSFTLYGRQGGHIITWHVL